MSSRAGVALDVGVDGQLHEPGGLFAHALDEAAQAGVESGAVDAAGGLGDVDHEIAGALELTGEPDRSHDRAEIGRHGLLQGEHVVAGLFDPEGEGVDLVVGLDEGQRTLHVVGEKDLGAARDELAHERRQLDDLVADLVQLLVEGLALLGHRVSCR
jgi:hypothetical protein